MIIAGPCLFNDGEYDTVFRTYQAIKDHIDIFRCKIWGGGTKIDRYFPGIGQDGLDLLERINDETAVITEVQTPEQIQLCDKLYSYWLGARNSQNYGLIEAIDKDVVFVKRHPSMKISSLISLCDLIEHRTGATVYPIERGIDTIDSDEVSRWAPDLRIAYYLKFANSKYFERLIVDCSHSGGSTYYVEDIYKAFKAIGINNFMFEVLDGVSQTDTNQVLSVEEFKKIVGEKQ